MKLNKTPNALLALGFCLTMLIAPKAKADPYHLKCKSPTTCTQINNGGLVAGSGSSVTFDIINTDSGQKLSGEAFVLVLVPKGGAAPTGSGTLVGTFNNFSSGSIWSFIGFSKKTGGTGYNFGVFQGDSQQVGVNLSSYTVYEFNVGSISNCGQGTCLGGLAYNNLAKGSVIISFLENGKGVVIEQNPNSDSITGSGVTPEPGSMALLGSGLALVGGYLRRNRRS